MLHLSTVFQVSIYGLAALSAAMLALAEGSAIPTGLTVPLAVLAFFFTERWKVVRFSTPWVNLFGVLAVLTALGELWTGNIEARLLSGAHLLVYLSWIVLFQEKMSRHYWQMCALGVLQVAVGSVLTIAGVFGFLLFCYLFFAIWTLSVFALYQAQERFGQTIAELPATAASLRTSVVRSTIQHDPQERWISSRFVCGTLATASLSIVIAAMFFLLIPRFWIGPRSLFRDQMEPGRSMSGFTEDVTLGDFGQILESTQRVLEIRVFDHDTGNKLDVEEYSQRLGYDEPLFRGASLTRYEHGGWGGRRRQARTEEVPNDPVPGSVRQEIRMQPIRTSLLFAIHPVEACRIPGAEDHHVLRQTESSMLLRPHGTGELPGGGGRGIRHYVIYSPQRTPQQQSRDLQVVSRRHLQLPPGLERLTAEAQRVAGTDQPPQQEMARRLVAYLRDSGQFRYSLDTSIEDRSIDPVEDFLFNRREGHCEYYASALALMLRAVGIPSRLVSGFKGGKVNRITGFFEVEQRHAHAWVEAHIDGRWVVLDATPSAARTQSVDSMAFSLATWHDLVKFVREFWTAYVVQMDFRQQRDVFYAPLQTATSDWWAALRDRRSRVEEIGTSIKEFLSSPERWISWQGGVATFVLLLLLSALVWLARRGMRLWRRIRLDLGGRLDKHRRQVEFYERFQKLCAGRGLVRETSQTPQEFADVVHCRLNEALAASGLSEFPGNLVESFYRVRFGAETLDPEKADEIDRRLTELEQSLSASADPK